MRGEQNFGNIVTAIKELRKDMAREAAKEAARAEKKEKEAAKKKVAFKTNGQERER